MKGAVLNCLYADPNCLASLCASKCFNLTDFPSSIINYPWSTGNLHTHQHISGALCSAQRQVLKCEAVIQITHFSLISSFASVPRQKNHKIQGGTWRIISWLVIMAGRWRKQTWAYRLVLLNLHYLNLKPLVWHGDILALRGEEKRAKNFNYIEKKKEYVEEKKVKNRPTGQREKTSHRKSSYQHRF